MLELNPLLLIGADGWSGTLLTTPSARSKVASQHFLIAQPPLL